MHNNSYLIAYDIRCPKRLAKLHRYMKKNAIAVQKSVFIAHLDINDLPKMKQSIIRIIDEHVDDVRIYRLPAHVHLHTLGQADHALGLTSLIENDTRHKNRAFMLTYPLQSSIKPLE
jgi:CRISPR-associated protein Cas2